MHHAYWLVFESIMEFDMAIPVKLLGNFWRSNVHFVRIWIIFWSPEAQTILLRIWDNIYDFVFFFSCFVVFYDIVKRRSSGETICLFWELFE